MANQATLTIRVRAARGSCTVSYATKGKYVSLITNTVQNVLPGQAVQPSTTAQAFWASVIDLVEQDITGHT